MDKTKRAALKVRGVVPTPDRLKRIGSIDKRIGSIQAIIRISKTRWGGEATFASIDGEHFYGVSPNAQLGQEFEVWKEGAGGRPIAATKLWVLRLSGGYWEGHHDDYVIENV